MIAQWTRGADAGDTWTRTAGPHAPPLVTRGVVGPTNPDDMDICEGMHGGRFGAAPLRLEVHGDPRTLHVWGRARGPLGVRAGRGSGAEVCASAGAGRWAKLDLEGATGEITIEVGDVDHRGERRGQTSPYVLVITDDDVAPADEPDERARLDPRDVTVRWALASVPCSEAYVYCARPTLQLGGAVQRTIPLKQLFLGQSGCWPDGTGVTCAGASGSSFVSLSTSSSGAVEVVETSESDGYCEPDAADKCQSVTTWTKFQLRPGVRLVPDPAGTFPPPK